MVAIWFPHLVTDWMLRRQLELKDIPFALVLKEGSRRIIKATNSIAYQKGVSVNMVVADCKALVPELQIFDYNPEQPLKLLTALAEWCIRYTPFISIDLPDVLILDVRIYGKAKKNICKIYNSVLRTLVIIFK